MMLFNRKTVYNPVQITKTDASLLGTTAVFPLDRTWPWEEMLIRVCVTLASTGPVMNGSNIDGILAILKNVQVFVPPNTGNLGLQPPLVVNMSGPGLLEYARKTAGNLDRSTLEAIRLNQKSIAGSSAIPASTKIQITYRVPFVHPRIAEPLRTAMLLPVHTYAQDPQVSLTFESWANISSTGSSTPTSVTADILMKRRTMPAALDQQIQQNGGYLPFDLTEQAYNVPLSTAGVQRFAINVPGSYGNLLFRHYLGGSTVTRFPIDQTTTFGLESQWTLQSGGNVTHSWLWAHLQADNDFDGVQNGLSAPNFVAATSAGSPTVGSDPSPDFGSPPASNTTWVGQASCLLDFLGAGYDSVNELGSVLDCNLPAQSGLKMEVVGPCASVATTASTLFVSGHRYFGDLSKFQLVKAG